MVAFQLSYQLNAKSTHVNNAALSQTMCVELHMLKATRSIILKARTNIESDMTRYRVGKIFSASIDLNFFQLNVFGDKYLIFSSRSVCKCGFLYACKKKFSIPLDFNRHLNCAVSQMLIDYVQHCDLVASGLLEKSIVRRNCSLCSSEARRC